MMRQRSHLFHRVQSSCHGTGVGVCKVWENNGGNSRNSRCQVWTYKMLEGTSASAYVLCPFQTLVIRFQNKEIGGDWRIGMKVWSCSQSRTLRPSIKVRTYLIFQLKYLLDKSKEFILSNGINKRINWGTNNKQSP